MPNINNNSGTLTWTEFDKHCAEFCIKALALHDDWVYRTIKEDPGYSYLEKRVVRLTGKGTVSIATTENVEETEEPQNVQHEDSSVIPTGTTEIITCTYHILYSLSYNVPVLYFNMFKADGRLLNIEEIWHQVPNEFQTELQNNAWGAITQMEHPLLGVPYFQIHPCRTEKLMSTCPYSSNYIVSWLSMLGPLVGLNLSLAYADHLHQKSSMEHNTNINNVDTSN